MELQAMLLELQTLRIQRGITQMKKPVGVPIAIIISLEVFYQNKQLYQELLLLQLESAHTKWESCHKYKTSIVNKPVEYSKISPMHILILIRLYLAQLDTAIQTVAVTIQCNGTRNSPLLLVLTEFNIQQAFTLIIQANINKNLNSKIYLNLHQIIIVQLFKILK